LLREFHTDQKKTEKLFLLVSDNQDSTGRKFNRDKLLFAWGAGEPGYGGD